MKKSIGIIFGMLIALLAMVSCQKETIAPTGQPKSDTTFVISKLVIHDGNDGGAGFDRTFEMKYDANNQLTSLTADFGVYGNFTNTFLYDKINHTITRSGNGKTTVYTFSVDSLLLKSVTTGTTNTYTYDANKKLAKIVSTTLGTYSVVWNASGVDSAYVSNTGGVWDVWKVKNTNITNSFGKVAPGVLLTILDETDFPFIHFFSPVDFSYLRESGGGIYSEYNFSTVKDAKGYPTLMRRRSVDNSIKSDIFFYWDMKIKK